MRPQSSTDHRIAALAANQHGVVARSQLLHAGLSAEAIKVRVRARRLHRLHRGVYAVGHRVLTREGRWMAAVFACGDGAVLSHRTAAAVWELQRNDGAIHVTVRGSRKAPRGIRLHRTRALTDAEITRYRGIPVTNVARTIVDLARSEMERRFRRLCRDHGLPQPETNTVIDGYRVDFVWCKQRLIVEVDGYRYHRSPRKFEADREQDVTLSGRGWRTLRFTWRQITHRTAWVADAVRTGAGNLAE